MKKITIFLFVFMAFALAACQGDTKGTTEISAEELETRLDEGRILDVRTPAEFSAGHVPGAELLPLQDIQQNESSYQDLDRSETYFVICQSGNRSSQAVAILEEQGFENLVNVTGGMNAWAGDIEK